MGAMLAVAPIVHWSAVASALAPYVTMVLLTVVIAVYRKFKPYKKDPVRNKWDYLERNPVELAYLMAMGSLCLLILPSGGSILKLLL